MNHTIREVLQRDMCVGCGGCSVATGGAIPIQLTRFGTYQPDLSGVDEEVVNAGSRVCPFSDDSPSESEISDEVFPKNMDRDGQIGAFTSLYVGRVRGEKTILGSSSGGLTSWLLEELLSRDMADAVIHVGSRDTTTGGPLFEYAISDSRSQLHANRKSVYYATTFADILNQINHAPQRRYIFVGVPCFVKAVRSCCSEDPQLGSQIKYFVGLVCGHMKSQRFAESLAWQLGVDPDALAGVDFRLKNANRPVGDYDFGAKASTGIEQVRGRTLSLLGGNWGHGAFQLNACNYCDDIFAETADICFGDAWLPEFQDEWRGTNLVVTRNDDLERVLRDGLTSDRISLKTVTIDDLANSQAGNFRHRRVGLSVRLGDDLHAGLSIPTKRVIPDRHAAPRRRRRLIRQRRHMSAVSHAAFEIAREVGELGIYVSAMTKEVKRYRRIERGLMRRLIFNLRRFRAHVGSKWPHDR